MVEEDQSTWSRGVRLVWLSRILPLPVHGYTQTLQWGRSGRDRVLLCPASLPAMSEEESLRRRVGTFPHREIGLGEDSLEGFAGGGRLDNLGSSRFALARRSIGGASRR